MQGTGSKMQVSAAPSDRRGTGWIGRANDGVVTEEVLVEGEEAWRAGQLNKGGGEEKMASVRECLMSSLISVR